MVGYCMEEAFPAIAKQMQPSTNERTPPFGPSKEYTRFLLLTIGSFTV